MQCIELEYPLGALVSFEVAPPAFEPLPAPGAEEAGTGRHSNVYLAVISGRLPEHDGLSTKAYAVRVICGRDELLELTLNEVLLNSRRVLASFPTSDAVVSSSNDGANAGQTDLQRWSRSTDWSDTRPTLRPPAGAETLIDELCGKPAVCERPTICCTPLPEVEYGTPTEFMEAYRDSTAETIVATFIGQRFIYALSYKACKDGVVRGVPTYTLHQPAPATDEEVQTLKKLLKSLSASSS